MISQCSRSLMRLSTLRCLTRQANAAVLGNVQLSGAPERLASTHVVMEHTNVPHEEASRILKQHKLLRIVDDDKVNETATKLKELGISTEDIARYPEVLAILALTIENHANLLYECGFGEVTARDVAFYKRLITRRISLLKAYNCLSDNTCIVSNVLSKIPGLPKQVADEIEKKTGQIDEKSNLRDIHKKIVFHYLCWRLDASEDEIKRIFKTYFRIRNKSLALISQCIDMLINDMGFTKQKILKHGYLIHGYPAQIEATRKRVPTLGGLPVLEVIHKHPRILLTNTQTLINTSNVFKQFGITDDAVCRCFTVYTLATRTVRERLTTAMNDPQLGGLLGHPRILLFVLNNRTAKKRLDLLRQLQMQCFTLNLISASSETKFGRFTTGREDFHRGYDVIHYISQSLGCDASNLRLTLNRHPHWNAVPLPNVRATMLVLAKRKFSPQLIFEAMHILLYPADHVEEVLDSMDYETPLDAIDWSPNLRYEHIMLDNGHESDKSKHTVSIIQHNKCSETNFSSGIFEQEPVEDTSFTDWHLVLQTCLYLLEKPHHFSGNGIWAHNSSKVDKEMASAAV